MSPDQIKKAVLEAYANAKNLLTQGCKVRLIGRYWNMKIEMWLDKAKKVIDTAYSKWGK